MADREGEGAKAMLLQDLCAAADQIVMVISDTRNDCSRGLDSGFASAILNSRKYDFELSTSRDKPGGVWSW